MFEIFKTIPLEDNPNSQHINSQEKIIQTNKTTSDKKDAMPFDYKIEKLPSSSNVINEEGNQESELKLDIKFPDELISRLTSEESKNFRQDIKTKSGMMLGLGETKEEVLKTMDDLLENNVDILTLGQYLQPTSMQVSVKEFITPEMFNEYKEIGLKKGFKFVESSPFTRSSYNARNHI